MTNGSVSGGDDEMWMCEIKDARRRRDVWEEELLSDDDEGRWDDVMDDEGERRSTVNTGGEEQRIFVRGVRNTSSMTRAWQHGG